MAPDGYILMVLLSIASHPATLLELSRKVEGCGIPNLFDFLINIVEFRGSLVRTGIESSFMWVTFSYVTQRCSETLCVTAH